MAEKELLRIVEVVLFEAGTAQSHMPRFGLPGPPTPARADIVDRNGRLLATTLDSPSVYANPKQIIDPAEAFADPIYQTRSGELPAGHSVIWSLAKARGISGLRTGENESYEIPKLDAAGL